MILGRSAASVSASSVDAAGTEGGQPLGSATKEGGLGDLPARAEPLHPGGQLFGREGP